MMKQLKKVICLAMVLLLMIPGQGIGAAAGGPCLSVSAPSHTLCAGDEFEVGVTLENNPGIVIFGLWLRYDDTRFDFVSVANGPVLAGQTLEVRDGVFNGFSAVRVTNGLRVTAFNGDGVLYTVRFRVKDGAAGGTTAFSLAYRAGDIAGVPIQPGNQPNNFTPDTDDADGTVTIQAGPVGVNVTGLVKSYNPGSDVTLKLLQGGEVKYSTAVVAPEADFGPATQPFRFENVQPGTYALVITKPAHTSFTVQTVAVGDEDVDLTRDSRGAVQLMTLLCGDINGDGYINDSDLAVLWQAANYNKAADQAANKRCDLNGDGYINDSDLAILWQAVHYNKGEIVIP